MYVNNNSLHNYYYMIWFVLRFNAICLSVSLNMTLKIELFLTDDFQLEVFTTRKTYVKYKSYQLLSINVMLSVKVFGQTKQKQ